MDKMQDLRNKIYKDYGKANDLEEKQRDLLVDFLKDKRGKVLELGCGNAKILKKLSDTNSHLDIYGIDYNENMVSQAKKNIPEFANKLQVGDMLHALNVYSLSSFDFVFCLNSLHNLPNKSLIYNTFDIMKKLVKPSGYIIFDIRNSFNPFVNYGYWKNRNKGLSFFTLNIRFVLNSFFKHYITIYKSGIYYNSLKEAGFKGNILKKFVYRWYLIITRFFFFSPYQFIILKK